MLITDYSVPGETYRALGWKRGRRECRPDWWTNTWWDFWRPLHKGAGLLLRFAVCCKHTCPTIKQWDVPNGFLWFINGKSEQVDPGDLAIILVNYHRYCTSFPFDRWDVSKLGYRGAIDDLVAQGRLEALQRKLSVDVNDLIPRYVRHRGTRKKLLATAASIARINGLVILASTTRRYTRLPTPYMVSRFPDGVDRERCSK